MKFPWEMLSSMDRVFALVAIGGDRCPDLVIAPDGVPYLYRWHLIPRNDKANVYFHIQVASDPDRPLHDHPWDNQTVILSGGYDELWEPTPWLVSPGQESVRGLRVGHTVCRKASEAHRLILPPCFPYTMTLFSTGPKLRAWGFWPHGNFVDAADFIEDRDGMSVYKGVKL